MKKSRWIYIIIFVLILAFILTLCMCGKDDKKSPDNDTSTDRVEKVQEETDEEEDVVIMSPDGETFLEEEATEEDVVSGDTDSGKKPNSNHTITETESVTDSEDDTTSSDSEEAENPFNLDKDGDGYVDGWH